MQPPRRVRKPPRRVRKPPRRVRGGALEAPRRLLEETIRQITTSPRGISVAGSCLLMDCNDIPGPEGGPGGPEGGPGAKALCAALSFSFPAVVFV